MDEAKLFAALGELAGAMAVDSSTYEIFDRLADCIIEVIPSTQVGITIRCDDTTPPYITGSSEQAIAHEQLQSELSNGPSLVAFDTGEAVLVANLCDDVRLERFAEATASTGLAAVFTFPLRNDCDTFGAMTLYRDNVGALESHDTMIAKTLADVTASYLVMARARDAARAAADSFKQLTLHDPLTGLPNRQLLEDRIEHAAEHARRSRAAAAVLFADLNNFKQINDTYGHGVGDELLVAVARRLSALLRSSDTLARLSGDEFVFLCENLTEPEDTDVIIGRICDALSVPFKVGGLELTVSASVGVAYAGVGDRISADLIAEADAAMYAIKRARRVPSSARGAQ